MPTSSVATGTPPRSLDRTAPTAPGFAAALRAATGDAHRDVESVSDLDAQLRDRHDYGALLRRLLPVQAGIEDALDGCLRHVAPPGVLVPAPHPRAPDLRADLVALGLTPHPAHAHPALPVLASFAAGLGCRYVLDGSALGGRIVAREARAQLGADLPTAFFGGAHAPRGADWRALQAALDAFGAGTDAAGRAAAVAAARQTFAVVGAAFRAPVTR